METDRPGPVRRCSNGAGSTGPLVNADGRCDNLIIMDGWVCWSLSFVAIAGSTLTMTPRKGTRRITYHIPPQQQLATWPRLQSQQEGTSQGA